MATRQRTRDFKTKRTFVVFTFLTPIPCQKVSAALCKDPSYSSSDRDKLHAYKYVRYPKSVIQTRLHIVHYRPDTAQYITTLCFTESQVYAAESFFFWKNTRLNLELIFSNYAKAFPLPDIESCRIMGKWQKDSVMLETFSDGNLATQALF